MEIIEAIEKQVLEAEPNMEPSDADFKSMCLILFMSLAEWVEDSPLDHALAKATRYSPEFCGQFLANMEGGGALRNGTLLPSVQQQVLGKNGHMVVCLMANVAAGRMKYYPKTRKYSLTDMGKRYVEKEMIETR